MRTFYSMPPANLQTFIYSILCLKGKIFSDNTNRFLFEFSDTRIQTSVYRFFLLGFRKMFVVEFFNVLSVNYNSILKQGLCS